MSCETACLETIITACTTPVIEVGLPASTTLMAHVSRPGSKKIYKREITTDSDSIFELDKASFPDGFFSHGYIQIEFKTGEDFDEEQLIIEGELEYSCLLVELLDIDED